VRAVPVQWQLRAGGFWDRLIDAKYPPNTNNGPEPPP